MILLSNLLSLEVKRYFKQCLALNSGNQLGSSHPTSCHQKDYSHSLCPATVSLIFVSCLLLSDFVSLEALCKKLKGFYKGCGRSRQGSWTSVPERLFWSSESLLPGMMLSGAVMKSAGLVSCAKAFQCKVSDTHNSCGLKLDSA